MTPSHYLNQCWHENTGIHHSHRAISQKMCTICWQKMSIFFYYFMHLPGDTELTHLGLTLFSWAPPWGGKRNKSCFSWWLYVTLSQDELIKQMGEFVLTAWWRHQMETFSALLAICAGNSPVPGEFPAQRPVTRSFDVSLICTRINGWVNNGEAGDLRRHRAHHDLTVMAL